MAEPILKKAEGYSRLTTNAIPSNLDVTELTSLHNMIYKSDGSIESRLGTALFKNNTQWGSNAVIDIHGYEINESGAEVVSLLENGKAYYIKVADYSADPRTIFNEGANWTEIARTGPANFLSISDRNEVYFKVLNNTAFAVDGKNQILYYGSDHAVHTVPDPVGYQITLTVDAAVAATLDAVYSDGTRTFNVEGTKSTGVGTTLILKQLTGDFRPAASGTLTNSSGTGDSSIAYTATTYSNVYIGLTVIAGRLVAVTKEGDIWISEANDGTDFNGAQSERLLYGKEDGLTITNAFAFARSVILNGTNQELRQSSSSSITGSVKPDANIIDEQNPDDFFRVNRESNRIALYGRSGKEITNGFVGLSKDGFIFVDSIDARKEFGINQNEGISSPIQDVVNRVNKGAANNIRATVDDENQRYLCAVPMDGSTEARVIFMYDFDNSTFALGNQSAIHKWSIFTYDFDEAYITSLSTVFGVPFIGLSDGSIIQTEISERYTDYLGNFESGYALKGEDFGLRNYFKTLHSGVINLIVTENTNLQIFATVDENSLRNDNNGQSIQTQPIYPFDIDADVWTAATTDVWSSDPLDVWGTSKSIRYPFKLQKSIPKFLEMSVVIKNVAGGSRWGAYGHEFVGNVEDEYSDPREYQSLDASLISS